MEDCTAATAIPVSLQAGRATPLLLQALLACMPLSPSVFNEREMREGEGRNQTRSRRNARCLERDVRDLRAGRRHRGGRALTRTTTTYPLAHTLRTAPHALPLRLHTYHAPHTPHAHAHYTLPWRTPWRSYCAHCTRGLCAATRTLLRASKYLGVSDDIDMLNRRSIWKKAEGVNTKNKYRGRKASWKNRRHRRENIIDARAWTK